MLAAFCGEGVEGSPQGSGLPADGAAPAEAAAESPPAVPDVVLIDVMLDVPWQYDVPIDHTCWGPRLLLPMPGDPNECVYDLTPFFSADGGKQLNPMMVMVESGPGSDAGEAGDAGDAGYGEMLKGVKDAQACSAGGWYFDDPKSPSLLILCPSTCAEVRANHGGSIVITFGCVV
jgi:hypothetical protein